MASLVDLPEESLIHILSFCSLCDVEELRMSCSFMNRLCLEGELWRLYFIRRYGINTLPRPMEVIDWKVEYRWRQKAQLRAQLFNEEPSFCIQHLFREQIIKNTFDLIQFLRRTSGLEHKIVYTLVAHPENFNLSPTAFSETIKQVDIKGKNITDSLRTFSASFGNLFTQGGQQMAFSALSDRFFELNGAEGFFESPQDVFTLMYSIVMLNTDAHNPQVQKKMTRKIFIQNMKSVHCKAPNDYLTEIYNDITQNEVKLDGNEMKLKSTEAVFCAWLKVNESTGSKKLWAILTNEYIVFYKKKTSTPHQNYRAKVNLAYNTKLHPQPQTNSCSFAIDNASVCFVFSTSTSKELDEWLKQIDHVLAGIKEESSLATSLFLANQ